MTNNGEAGLDAALATLRARLAPLASVEDAPLTEAACRVLAHDLIAPLDLPAFANAAMDGYAVRTADCRRGAILSVAGTAAAGHGFVGVQKPGSAIRIMTGAPVPEGADAIVMQEDTQRDGDSVKVLVDVAAGQHIRPRGQHIRQGDRLIAAGTLLHAPEIGLATLVGTIKLPVIRRLHVGIASTGDELVDPPAQPGPGGSFDGGRPMIAAACRSSGFRVSDLGICPDRAAAFSELLDQATRGGVDALLVIGGSALGDADVVRQASQVTFLGLNIRPGRGVTFGLLPRDGSQPAALLGLPGNAVAAFVMFHMLVYPALLHLAGGAGRVPVHIPIPLAEDLDCEPGRIDYRRGCYERSAKGDLAVRPLRQQGAGMLRTLVDADVLIAAGPERFYAAGTPIPVVPLVSLPR